MDEIELGKLVFYAITMAGPVIFKLYADHRKSRKADTEVSNAEKEAYKSIPEALSQKTQDLLASQEDLEHRSKEIKRLLDESQSALQMGSLFNLYNKQVEKYQTETQARAGWSFIFAIVSMFAGLGFIFWGGTQLLNGAGWTNVAAGTAISTIGGAVSAFITKTFLDVHKLSLTQLNRYFRQPVINSYILTAQRLSDQLENAEAKQKSYEKIIQSITSLIRETNDTYSPESLHSDNKITPKKKSQRKAAHNNAIETDAE